eukprot:ctg_3489.g426
MAKGASGKVNGSQVGELGESWERGGMHRCRGGCPERRKSQERVLAAGR